MNNEDKVLSGDSGRLEVRRMSELEGSDVHALSMPLKVFFRSHISKNEDEFLTEVSDSLLLYKLRDEPASVVDLELVRATKRLPFLLGRSERCDVRFGDPAVSRMHAHIIWEDPSWKIIDLGSRHGVFSGDTLLKAYSPTNLRPQTKFYLGTAVRLELWTAFNFYHELMKNLERRRASSHHNFNPGLAAMHATPTSVSIEKPGTAPKRIDRLVKEIRRTSRQDFISQHLSPFLLTWAPTEKAFSGADTVTVDSEAEAPHAPTLDQRLEYWSLDGGHAKDDWIIGRDTSCQVVLPNPTVSRRHAKLSWSRSSWVIRDLEARNGISINGELLEGKRDLQDDVMIRLGPKVVLFFLQPATLYDRFRGRQ